MGQPLALQVAEVRPEDAGRCLARLTTKACDELGLGTGDIILVQGHRATVARIARAAPGQGDHCLRIDGLTRQNARVSLGERVGIAPAAAVPARLVEYQCTGMQRPISAGDFLDLPVITGDTLRHVSFGRTLSEIRVTRTDPEGPVMLGAGTLLRPCPGSPETGEGPRLTYEDIGGLDHELARIRELVELPMRHPEIFDRLGIEPSRGILLTGPPGTGKTLIARTLAHEVKASFFAINGPEIVSKYYGESEAQLRQIFSAARAKAPSIIFLDEVDAIAPRRQEVHGDLEKRLVAQLLALMDGLGSRGQVVVIGATNLPDQIDPALRRPGRFDREVQLGLPDERARRQILAIHTRGMPLEEVDLDRLATLTPGYAGADLAFLCREAAMFALRRVIPLDAARDVLDELRPEDLTVANADFAAALREIVPAITREVAVEKPLTTWDEIGGQAEAKSELRRAIEWPLRYRQEFTTLGLRPPRGILLAGPPGVGKTMLARAASNAAGTSFISVKGAELLSKWLGDSERGVREIFRKARHAAPCVLFFDEVDALARRRGAAAAEAADRVVGQLLTEMDGLVECADVIVLGATNRADLLDPALLRPGRFENILILGLPDQADRAAILRLHLRGRALAADVDPETVAVETPGWSGAELAALCRRAAYLALEDYLDHPGQSGPSLRQAHLAAARERIGRDRKRGEALGRHQE